MSQPNNYQPNLLQSGQTYDPSAVWNVKTTCLPASSLVDEMERLQKSRETFKFPFPEPKEGQQIQVGPLMGPFSNPMSSAAHQFNNFDQLGRGNDRYGIGSTAHFDVIDNSPRAAPRASESPETLKILVSELVKSMSDMAVKVEALEMAIANLSSPQ